VRKNLLYREKTSVHIVDPDQHDDKQYDGKDDLAEDGSFSSVIAVS
jgi:hypothetical protein